MRRFVFALVASAVLSLTASAADPKFGTLDVKNAPPGWWILPAPVVASMTNNRTVAQVAIDPIILKDEENRNLLRQHLKPKRSLREAILLALLLAD